MKLMWIGEIREMFIAIDILTCPIMEAFLKKSGNLSGHLPYIYRASCAYAYAYAYAYAMHMHMHMQVHTHTWNYSLLASLLNVRYMVDKLLLNVC